MKTELVLLLLSAALLAPSVARAQGIGAQADKIKQKAREARQQVESRNLEPTNRPPARTNALMLRTNRPPPRPLAPAVRTNAPPAKR
jgi:hypothetical protein